MTRLDEVVFRSYGYDNKSRMIVINKRWNRLTKQQQSSVVQELLDRLELFKKRKTKKRKKCRK